jgi:hypothetical protein
MINYNIPGFFMNYYSTCGPLFQSCPKIIVINLSVQYQQKLLLLLRSALLFILYFYFHNVASYVIDIFDIYR